MLDRRHFDRFKIPDLKVVYYINDTPSKKCLVIDISRTSVRFEFTNDLRSNEYLEMEIISPHSETIIIKGRVTKIINQTSKNRPSAIVQFLPFGTNESFNSMKCHKQIKELLDLYLGATK
jgi:hypothetical protein